jgi:hypothetical protein
LSNPINVQNHTADTTFSWRVLPEKNHDFPNSLNKPAFTLAGCFALAENLGQLELQREPP